MQPHRIAVTILAMLVLLAAVAFEINRQSQASIPTARQDLSASEVR